MAQTQLYTKLAQCFVIEETSQDTYLTQTAASGFLAEIPDSPISFTSENYVHPSARGDFLNNDESPGMVSAQINLRVPLKHSGTVDVAPEWGEALKACGFEETTNAAVSIVYTPLGTFDGTGGNPGPSYSVTVLEAGNAYKIKGAFGNVVFNGVVGEPMFMEMTFTGAYVAIAVDALETITYDTTVAQPFLGATASMNFGGAVTPKGVANFSLDMGNNVVPVSDINDSSGIYGSRITMRKPVGSFDPEMVLQSTANSDFLGLWRAGTTGTFTTGAVGGTAGNKWTLAVARCVLRPPTFSDKNGIRVITCPFAVSSAVNDVEGTNAEITLTLT
jgi:hypothetical protein